MIVAIHQPEYFPWLGFLDKARRVDTLVLLDDVQFDRSSLQHRARVAGPGGLAWLTIPFVHRHPQRIDELAFVDDRWRAKHRKTLQACYGRAPGYAAAAPALDAFFAAPYARVIDATIASVHLLLGAFAIAPRVVRSSELHAGGEKAALVLAICRALGATRYLSGRTGATYLDPAAFAAAGVELEIQRYTPPAYRPLPDGARGLSALDAWLHLGHDAQALCAS
jgi:hypothetical protein